MGISKKVARLHAVELGAWPSKEKMKSTTTSTQAPNIIIASFACDIPDSVRAQLRSQVVSAGRQQTLWINLEYLSAEPWVDSHHWLPSRKSDGTCEMFYMPGFTEASGGILGIDANKESYPLPTKEPHQQWASVFAYPNAAFELLLTSPDRWHFFVPESVQIPEGIVDQLKHRITRVPLLSQPQYDSLLQACDLNFVRGEDSWVRAQLVHKPFIWQPYLQEDSAHEQKLKAFMDLAGIGLRDWELAMRQWSGIDPKASGNNGLSEIFNMQFEEWRAFEAPFKAWTAKLLAQSDLVIRLKKAYEDWKLLKS